MILAWACLFSFARASASELRTIEHVERAITTGEVTSVDQLWWHLPYELRLNAAISYRGPGPAPVSTRRPRFVGADDEGRLFAVIATNPKHPSYERLDLAAADPVTGELSLHRVDFRRDLKLTRNPRECLGCHQVNGTIRLRVESYPHWPGWFGHQDRLSEEPGVRLGLSETNAIVQYLRTQKRIARAPMHFGDGFQMGDVMHRNATRLTILAVRAEARAAHHRFRQTPLYERVRLALAAKGPATFRNELDEDLRADFDEAQPALEQELRANVIEYSRLTNEAFRRTNGGAWRTYVPTLEYASLIPFEWAYRRAGLTLATYSTSVAPGALDINTGLGTLTAYLRQFIADDLAAEYGLAEHAERSLEFNVRSLPEPHVYTDDFIPAVRAKMCARGLTP